MSFNNDWDVDKYREEHESDEHWELRKAFMERWRDNYPEERLICLARVFANIEFMGCRYPIEVMQEVATLSKEVAKDYRNIKKTKLQRTFVSASDAAEDRARGIKREGGVVINNHKAKSSKIEFVAQGQSSTLETSDETKKQVSNDSDDEKLDDNEDQKSEDTQEKSLKNNQSIDQNEFLNEMLRMKCIDPRRFHNSMFQTSFGRFVLLVRPWSSKLSNIINSCQVCKIQVTSTYERECFSLMMNGKLVAQASGSTKAEAKNIVEIMAWNRLREEAISVLVKELFIAQGDRISMNDVTGKKEEFGTPIENSVATKMMKLMGWKGGGLGADAQGIAEPIKPHLQMVNRAGLGSSGTDVRGLRRAGADLMRRYIAADTLDLDLVFSSEFDKDERAVLHSCAQKAGLASKSYGDVDRFLVVKKKLDPFSLVRAVVEKGGNTPKYQVFIPAALSNR
ncbi:NF-kappa-B-repressing factor-like [Aricia agestis]|uniref:NF-kappa-B-repressing factor-like n=1 Tax=Aricia agestis TaxID=91739 RepID=UPI001C208DC3|nr:NF-kappa-B-repressing factor-like [Aricia agestis]XP_041986581.1 NF-kappa-B-repressing factor-like [Aricia agestis]XP_041986589.1 NF-kappa-B-repressing factor-like [Aricia agestis]